MATDPRYQAARGDGHARRALEDLAVAEDYFRQCLLSGTLTFLTGHL